MAVWFTEYLNADKDVTTVQSHLLILAPSQKPVYNWKTEICSTIHLTNASITNLSFHNHLFLL